MRLLETWVATPLAEAVGWTLLHSLWEGAIVAAALAAALVPMRSARARYIAAWVAMLVMLCGIGFTLFRVIPDGVHGSRIAGSPAFPAWKVQTATDDPHPSNTALAVLLPWLARFWIVGVWIFALRYVASWVSGMPMAPAMRVLCARALVEGSRPAECPVAPDATYPAARVLPGGNAPGGWPYPSGNPYADRPARWLTCGTDRSHPAA